ncbi:mprA, partial [Symbiodinium sp. KB8]
MTDAAAHLLVVDDDAALRDSLDTALGYEGYRITTARDGAAALDALSSTAFDLVVLDIGLPNVDGLSVCRTLRHGGDRTPVLLLTARGATTDRVDGLDAGADDYVVKPFALDELFARVRALLRRSAPIEGGTVRVGGLVVDTVARRATVGGRPVDLTKTEFDLLAFLTEHRGKVLTRSEIYERIWGYDFDTGSRSLDVYVSYLRSKLEAGGAVMGRRTAPLSRVVAVAIGATVAVAMLIGGLLTDRVVRAEQYGAVDDFLVASTDRPLPPPDDERPTVIPEGDEGVIRAFTSRVTDDIAIRIVSDDGELLTPTDGVQLPDPPADSTDGELRTVTVDGNRYRVITTTTEWGAEVQIGRNLDEADTTVASIRRWLLAAGVVATAIAFGIGWWWSRRIARPIVRLAETADGVAERGEIDRRSATVPDGPTIAEVERLRSSFTSMLDALAASSDQQRRLVADASHELRTPLTVLRTNAELAASDRLTPDH